jgi:hypothetical protein
MCDRRPPVAVHHRAGSASLIRTLPCGVWNSGGWDALVVLSVVEQLDVVRAVLAGDVIEVAARLGMHRSTVQRWMARYPTDQQAGLADRLHRPGQGGEAFTLAGRCYSCGWEPSP